MKDCKNCIHYKVCRYRYEDAYPEEFKRIISEKCEDYLPEPEKEEVKADE